MATKIPKKRKEVLEKVDLDKKYSLDEASKLVKEVTNVNFDATVDLSVRLGVDPRKSDQMVRGSVSLPHGTGRDVSVLVLCPADKEEEAKNAGADWVGLDEYIEKIKNGWLDMDVVITTPNVMGKVGPLGKILGPRGLMPNPKTGTVTMDIAKAVQEVKAGKIDFRVDKNGIIHTAIGKASFEPGQIKENAEEVVKTLKQLKPAGAKGTYIKSVAISSTMSPGIKVEPKSVA